MRGVKAASSPPRSRTSDEDGVATVLALVWMMAIVTVAWVATLAAVIAARQHHLDGAADLAALSAARVAQSSPSDGCATAARIAQSNGVSLLSCRRDGSDVVVTVGDAVDLPWNVDGAMTATARAGP
jgi:secretion/DNA translocation related TadE-like protein